jgi:cytochrome c oxidase subunit II
MAAPRKRHRRRWLAVSLLALVLVLAASWFGWSREGLAPVDPASRQAERILDLYLVLGLVAVAILLAVAAPLALILSRDGARGAPREVEGAQVHGHTRLELIWAAVPLAIVLLLSGYTTYRAASINDPVSGISRPDLVVEVEGRQFYWRYRYENGAISIDRLRLPVGQLVELRVGAPAWDVQHSWWAPALNGKVDAIPGQTNLLSFRPDEVGIFEGRCSELCGLQHAAMELTVEVMPQRKFTRWLNEAAPANGLSLGGELWGGVCAKCHGAAPEYAPDLKRNTLLRDRRAVARIVRQGFGRMPAVGRGWTDAELRALVRFTRTIAGDDGN